MEENSSNQMETDVSSTKADVPDTQEVTGSDGQVEMVIVVEKVQEGQMDSPACKLTVEVDQSNSDDKESSVSSDPVEKSPQKSSDKSPEKSSVTETTHQKSQPLDKSPSKSTDKGVMKISKDSELPVIVIRSPITDKISTKSPVKIIPLTQLQKTPPKSPCTSQPVKTPQKPSPPKVLTVEQEKNMPPDSPEKKLVPSVQIQVEDIDSSSSTIETKSDKKDEGKECTDNKTQDVDMEEPTNMDKPQLETKKTPYKPESDSSKPEVVTKTNVISIDMEKEASNDSQLETCSDTSEREHKSISRELKSLIKSAKESKIISECTQLTSKTRKSRTLDSSNISLNMSVEAEKIQGARRGSNNSVKSNCSEKSEKVAVKRSMRSQNPEFVTKVKQFLNSVTGKKQEENESEEAEVNKSKDIQNTSDTCSSPKKKKVPVEPISSDKPRSDTYCWRCHWTIEQGANEKTYHQPMMCTVCPRSFHFKCLPGTERNKINLAKSWVCPECLLVLHAENSETRSPAMKKITLGMLCDLLKYALERMMELNGVEPFTHPVDQAAFPDYEKYVVHPMHLNQIQENITAGHYGSTEAFIGDVQWILHNSIIFNTMQSKLTGAARALVRLCRAEMGEIEACPECYAGAHARRPTWFTDVCSTPHILLWAKLKGFPYWPAKGMTVNESGLVDVRFFGAHDRAWVPARDCFLYSEKDPNNFRTKRQDIIDSMQEAEQHIRNISRKYGKFVYPPFKTVFDPTKLSEQLKMMIPSFEGEVVEPAKQKPATVASSPNLKNKSRSNSKSSKSDFNEGDISEGEDASAVQSRKMADGAEIAMEDESVSEKNKTIEIEVPPLQKDSNSSRKRRRSDLEEATLTVLNTSSKEKKKRVETEEVAEKKKSTEVKKPSTPKSSAKKVEASDKKDVPKDTEVPDETAESKEKPEKEVAEDATSNKNNDKSTKSETKSVEKPTKTYNNSSLILSSSTDGSKPKLTFKITLDKSNKRVMRTTSTTLVKDATKDKSPARNEQKKPSKVVKPLDKINRTGTPEDKAKRRRSSKSNKSSNSSQTKTDKKTTEGKKDASKNESANKSSTDNSVSTSNTPSATSTPKSSKDRLQFDDDTSLAVIAREVAKKSIVSNSVPGLPTISSVRSLSTSVQSTVASTSTVTRSQKTVEPAVTNSSKETSKNKEADKKKGEQSSIVGTVGVRAFARMTSPDKILEPEVEIKTEPIELDEDPERHNEKMDLMNAFRLQPVNQQPSLREMRINKVFVGPVGSKTEVRPRAKKTFPQPKKSASELNCKNSMVYIPIQPPLAQAPPHIRPRPPTSVNGAVVTVSKPVITCANNLVNTMATPLMPNSSAITIANTTSTVVSNAMVGPVSTVGPLSTVGPMANMATMSTLGAVPTIGPSNVHTVPLITSVNGQWTFSLQPMMSLGGINSPPSPPVNGVRPGVGLASITPTTVTATPAVNTPPEPPRLQQRPLLNPLDASTPLGAMPPPSTAGPLTAKLNQSAVKLADFFRTLMEDCMEKVDDPTAQLAALKLKMEQTAWKHQQEIDEVKHNNGLVLAEMRASLEKEKVRIINEMRRNAQAELEAAVKVAKSKQWCANCSQEAQFYCCWNTSYCDYQCQRSHWPQHHAVCTQQNAQGKSGESGSNSDKRPPETLPKTTQAPVPAPPLTVGGKPATKGSQNTVKQPSIIMSMVEDSNGAQSMRCVGTYKVPDSSPNSSVLINKQAMNSEDNAAAKKVVTSGGYLIVGGNSNNAPMVAPARRTHAVQYFS